jgi:integrase
MSTPIRLTLRAAQTAVVRATDPPCILWDKDVPGFGLRVMPSGVKSYFVKYRAGGRQRWVTIGRHGAPWTPETARRRAREILGEIARGDDPAERRDRNRVAETVGDLAATYLADYAAIRKKPRSYEEDRRNLSKLILPAFATFRIADVTRADVARWHRGLSGRPIAANRALALLRCMFNLAERWGLRADNSNPTRHAEPYPERARERFLSAAEIARLGEALTAIEVHKSEPVASVWAIRLLILTGARLSEILTLEWSSVDFERCCLRLPDSKTGAKVVPLGAPALDILAKLPRHDGNPYVLPATRGNGHFVGIQKCWQRIRADAGFPNVRIHDLRHSFASVAVAGGDSLFLVGKILGHRQTRTTERYAHLSDDPVRAAADRTASRIAALLSPSAPTATVLALPAVVRAQGD